MDTEKSNLITEQLLQAMDIIANKKIENLPFDKTILCTITSVKDKDGGIYEVSANTDSTQANRSYFQAFAQEGAVYEVGDNVYVNVPQNDFSNQKTIISKYISEQAKPVNYINPMEQFIKLEEIDYTEGPNYYGLKANSETQFQYKIFEKVYDLNNMPKNYDCLGISADFTTLLGSYKPLDGEYGLRFEFGGLKDGWDTDTGDVNKYLALKEVTFSNREMYGMTYDFFTPSHQEKLINLQDFPYPIKIVRCYFYQNKNFRDINNNEIPGKNYEWDELNKTWKKPIPKKDGEEQRYIAVNPDIQMNNLICTFGYLMSDAKDGDLRLYTTSTMTYAEDKSDNQNKKTLKLRWLLNDEDGNLKAIDELEDKAPKDDYSWWENKIIYLYKYTYGKDETDPYAGPFWERIASYGKYAEAQTVRSVELVDGKYKPDSDQLEVFFESDSRGSDHENWGVVDTINQGVSAFTKPFGIIINITNDDKNSVFARYKVIILERDFTKKDAKDEPCTKNLAIDATDENAYVESSDVITTGIYQVNNEIGLKIYESNEITFENENEVAGKAAMALINGLELECVDGSNGIYRIYGEDNKITAQTNSQSMKLRANFNTINILGLDAGEANITWYYPKTNTMFISPIDKTVNTIDVYKPISVTLTIDTEDLNSYYVKVNEQYYQLGIVNIEGTNKVGYTRQDQVYELASGQIICLKISETVQTAAWKQDIDPNYYILKQTLDVSQYKDEEADSIMPFNNEIVYTIDSFYASNRTNNTIKCKIERYGREYWAEKEFFFGHQGNNGTNYAFDISLEREYDNTTHKEVSDTIVPFLKNGNTNFIKVKATLIYGKDEITDSNILNKIRWGWEVISREGEGVASTPHISMYDSNYTKQDSPTGSIIYLQLNSISDLSKYYAILKAEITKDIIDINKSGQNDTNKQRPVTLSTYLPIGISANNNIQTYIGGTSILYNDYGSDPVYYEGEHQLIGVNKNNIEWKFLNSDTSATSDLNSLSPDSYYPQMLERQEEEKAHTYEWFIRPTTMYFSGINNTGRIVVKNGDTIIFVQPIFIAQNAWGNQTINQWDGALKIDSEGNYILSSMIGAGVKNDDNTFSGVLLGQVGKDYDAKTGIYGYGSGVQTYGFREDGTAFIGASGKGRINFNGKNATITSGNYGSSSGMKIDLSNGEIDAYNFTLTAGSSNEQIIITSNNNKTDGKYDENPLTIGSKFKVAWDGTVTMSQAQIGGDWSGTGYAQSSSKTIEDILQALADKAEDADDATNALVDAHWEPDNLYSQFIKWPDQQFIQQKNSEGKNLYWQSSYVSSAYYSTDSSDYPYIERYTSNNETWKISDGKRLYFQLSPSSSNTQTTPNQYPVVKENEAYTHFVLTNRTYGDATHEYILEKDGSLFAKNGVFSGLISAYAGDLGGWVISPGLMSYGYKMKLIQNDNNYYWQGDFFGSNTSNATINADPDKIGGASNNNTTTGISDDLKNITSSVSVDTSKAFIYLRNSGKGIGVTDFADKSVPSTGVIQNASYFLSTNTDKSQPEYGRLKNIIFSLGKNFAVDKDGNLYASSGYFSGTIYANAGEIGGWSINTNTLTAVDNTLFLNSAGTGSAKINNISKDDLVIYAGSNFGVDKNGKLYANEGDFSGKIIAKSGTIGAWNLTEVTSIDGGDLYAQVLGKEKIVLDPRGTNTHFTWIKHGNSSASNINTYISVGNKFGIDTGGKLYASSAELKGILTADAGSKIGPWEIDTDSIYYKAYSTGKDTTSDNSFCLYPAGHTVNSVQDTVLHIGANFKILKDGSVQASKGKIGGWTIDDNYLTSNSDLISLTSKSYEGILLYGSSNPGINIVMPSPSPKNIYDITVDNGSNPATSWAAWIKQIFSNVITQSIQRVTPKIFIREKDQNYWSGLNQYGLLISSGSTINSYYSNSAYIGNNLTVQGSSLLYQINGIKITGTGSLTRTDKNGNATGRSNWTSSTIGRGLHLNTVDENNNFWRNSFYTQLLKYGSLSNQNYVAFIRGFGSDSTEPNQVFLGSKYYQSTSEPTSYNWSFNADYKFYIQYGGDAYFHSITLGDGTHVVPSYVASNKNQILAVNSDGNGLTWVSKPTSTTVSFTRSLASGTKIGAIIINGTSTDLYCETDTDTTYASFDDGSYGYWGGQSLSNLNYGTYLMSPLWFTNSSFNYTTWGSSGGYANRYTYGIYTNGSGAFKNLLCENLIINGTKVSLTEPVYGSNVSFNRVNCDTLYVGGLQVLPYSSGANTDWSDLRLKQNLQKIINLDLYDNLIPYSFEWKKDNKKSYGFIAQDIEKLSQKYENNSDTLYYKVDNQHPDYIDDNQEYRINYEQFHALHVAKNHQQDARIQSLESEVASLRAELQQLKNRIKGE